MVLIKKLVHKRITILRRLKHIKKPPHYLLQIRISLIKKFTYHPWTHNQFNKIFKHHNIVLTLQNKYSIINLLNSTRKEIRNLSDQLQGLREDIYRKDKMRFGN